MRGRLRGASLTSLASSTITMYSRFSSLLSIGHSDWEETLKSLGCIVNFSCSFANFSSLFLPSQYDFFRSSGRTLNQSRKSIITMEGDGGEWGEGGVTAERALLEVCCCLAVVLILLFSLWTTQLLRLNWKYIWKSKSFAQPCRALKNPPLSSP